MTLTQQFGKSDFFGHRSFTQLIHNVVKFRKKPKIFVKVIQRTTYEQHIGWTVKRIHQKPPKLKLR